MALVYPHATVTPGKRELMNAWLPSRPWFDGSAGREPVGSFRFDDSEGQVGMEGFLLGGEGLSTLFVPLTYRPAELEDAEEHLVGTAEHTVLGTRWVYDGCGDPVFAQAIVTAILTGRPGVDYEYEGEHGPETRPTTAQVRGSGSADTAVPEIDAVGCRDEGALTLVDTGPLELVVTRVVGTPLGTVETLSATWPGAQDVPIAGVRPG
jgi:hypothetical protein